LPGTWGQYTKEIKYPAHLTLLKRSIVALYQTEHKKMLVVHGSWHRTHKQRGSVSLFKKTRFFKGVCKHLFLII
jgi:hypothetical protein